MFAIFEYTQTIHMNIITDIQMIVLLALQASTIVAGILTFAIWLATFLQACDLITFNTMAWYVKTLTCAFLLCICNIVIFTCVLIRKQHLC